MSHSFFLNLALYDKILLHYKTLWNFSVLIYIFFRAKRLRNNLYYGHQHHLLAPKWNELIPFDAPIFFSLSSARTKSFGRGELSWRRLSTESSQNPVSNAPEYTFALDFINYRKKDNISALPWWRSLWFQRGEVWKYGEGRWQKEQTTRGKECATASAII